MSRLLDATVGSVGQPLDEGIVLVSWKICGDTGSVVKERCPKLSKRSRNLLVSAWIEFSLLENKLTAFALVSLSGLTYLALWMCAKLSIVVQFLNHSPIPTEQSYNESARLPIRLQAYLVIYPLFAIGLAIYVSLTQYTEFWHHGFDIIAGAVLGIATAWVGFYWYHFPIQRGGEWA